MRLNQQQLEDVKKQIQAEHDKFATEEIVFQRMSAFLSDKIKAKEAEQKAWQKKKQTAETDIKKKIEELKKNKDKNGIILQEMREKQIENEMETHQQEEKEEQAELEKEWKRIEDRKMDRMIRLIQDEFEKNSKGGGKKGKKGKGGKKGKKGKKGK